MNRLLLIVLTFALLGVPGVLAHGEDAHGEVTEQRVRAEGEIRPGRILELDFETYEGEEIAFTVDADEPISWDIHEHSNGQVVEHEKGVGTAKVSGTFTAPHDGVFSFMVLPYDNATGDVRMTLEGKLSLTGSSGLDLNAEAPAPWLVLLLGVTALGALVSARYRSR